MGGLIYLAAAAYTGSFTLFRPETNAAKKVNDLNMAIGQVEVDENEPELILETRGFSCSK
ncbi:hypothetical protein [Legionella sp. km772]|uniref:hypothetical protein n=1 Tax=Legionella sp. km772 TaxID=2498111 RepID=UPI000F8F398D|nr:hypothetical protein [Legionella sp. km772]RUR10572.1 hypothetical protein ELY15_08000 [Legionella sp. km772]